MIPAKTELVICSGVAEVNGVRFQALWMDTKRGLQKINKRTYIPVYTFILENDFNEQ